MIASLSGRVLEKLTDSIVLEVGGVGLQVYVPAPTRDRLRNGESVFLYTHLVVREDSLTLFGFEARESMEFFNLLLTVNGVGPRLALGVLSTLSPDAIRRAVFHEQADVFSRVPGVGRKTAQKILLQLQDRLPSDITLEPISRLADTDTEVLGALTTLGYSVVEAQAAIQSIPRDSGEDPEERLRLALQYFSK
jgi:Holliday junction DNA helicase RuvA